MYSIGLIYLFSIIVGYLPILCSRTKSIIKLAFFERLPILLTLGLLILTVIIYILSFLIISAYLLIIISTLSLIILCYHFKKKIKIINIFSYEDILPVILFFSTFLYFSNVISIMKWPPPGDIFNHGLYTSILLYNKKLGFTLAPYAPNKLTIPIVTGLHTLSSTLSMLIGLLPGESVFIIGCSICILLINLLYTLTYINTHSKILSLLSFLSAFIVGPGLEYWVLGYFYNGPYPTLFGLLSVLFFITYLNIINNERKENLFRSLKNNNKLILLIILVAIIVTYPPFIILSIAYLILLQLFKGNLIKFLKLLKNRRYIITIILCISLMIFFYISIKETFIKVFEGILYYLNKIYGRNSYKIDSSIFYTSIVGVSIIISGFFSILFIIKKNYLEISTYYFLVFIINILSLHPLLYPTFSIILPRRSLMICSLLSWIIISIFLNDLCNFVHSKLSLNYLKIQFRKKIYNIKFNSILKLIIFLSLLKIINNNLIYNFTYKPAYQYSWLMRHGFEQDFDILFWIHKNISPHDLILDDFSWTSRYLLSLSIKNVTSRHFPTCSEDIERAREALKFWKNPRDYTLFLNLVKKYNIKYVFTTSERMYHDWAGAGGDGRYKLKPFNPQLYILLFDENPYLKPLVKSNTAGIYKVVSPLSVHFKSRIITDDNQSSFWQSTTSGRGKKGPPALFDDSSKRKVGSNSLKLIPTNGSWGYQEIKHVFKEPQDWSDQDYIAFYWFGKNTQIAFSIFIRGPTMKDCYQYSIKDCWEGWHFIIIPLRVPNKVYGNPDIRNVIMIQITFEDIPKEGFNIDSFMLLRREDQ